MSKCWIRYNYAGYKPARPKVAIVLAEADSTGAAWRIKKDNAEVLSGTLGAGTAGDDVHVAQAFSYEIDFSALVELGEYSLELDGADPAKLIIADDPYGKFATQALRHLRTVRSGCDSPVAKAGHLGDAAAIVYHVDGDWEQGAWKEAAPRRTLDMLGGHYDAGDFIKFTLTIASMAWHLLRAYEENPALFVREHSTTDLIDVLDEAKYALDYLAKTLPDENTFVVQVGAGDDHNQGWRLPADDKLDGKRPAFCALSRVHMGATAAALALGAKLFKTVAIPVAQEAAARYEERAIAIYARATRDDTQISAFERNTTNDFYYDRTDTDNMALAAAELYKLTGNENYAADGEDFAPPPSGSVSWSSMNGDANCRLAQSGDDTAKARFLEEVRSYHWDNVWQLPGGRYSWGSLPVWMGTANNHEIARRHFPTGSTVSVPFLAVLDYTFGRNNWGAGMIASPDLPHSIKNVYSFVRNVLGELAVGALSEGPGRKQTHDSFKHYFKSEGTTPFDLFNTSAAVFTDNSYDFMIAESTIWGQGNLLLMLALA